MAAGEEDNWPKAIDDDYQRIRPLGEGAFGIVWLAKAKNRPETAIATSADEDDDSTSSREKDDTFPGSDPLAKTKDDSPLYVAIKQINASKDGEKQYAAREIAILGKINHPNVVRCLRSVELPRSQLVVLTLADGPDLNELVDMGGALSTSLVRLAARHLISAVAYLHGRGVIHRDIKPDNCVLAKADSHIHNKSDKDDWMANDDFWDDKVVFYEKEWKIVLVDFGFAKALSPAEIGLGGASKNSSVRNLVQRGIDKQASQHELQKPDSGSSSQPSSTPHKMGPRAKLNRTGSVFQRTPIRAMSALGTRAFAAPEVTKARKKSDDDAALTDDVSDYGLIADAYSIGCTIRVLLTGVPPDQNEMEFISGQNNILLDMISAIFSCGKKTKGGNGKHQRKKRYKFMDESPKPARELVRKLVKPVYSERLTVPSARNEPWIKGGVSADDPVVKLPTGDVPTGNDDPIVSLFVTPF